MATDLTGLVVSIINRLKYTATKAGDLDNAIVDQNTPYTTAFTFGTGDNECNQFWADQRTLAGGATDNLDLAGGITNRFGSVATFAKVKGVFIYNGSADQTVATTATITVGAAASNPCALWFTETSGAEVVALNGTVCRANPLAGWTITGASADVLKIINNDGAASARYDIYIAGVSA